MLMRKINKTNSNSIQLKKMTAYWFGVVYLEHIDGDTCRICEKIVTIIPLHIFYH